MTRDPSFDPGRRWFFREALSKLIKPVADRLENHSAPTPRSPSFPRGRVLLRPPGAIQESWFTETCHRCGACVEACPAHAIFALDFETRVGKAPGADSDRESADFSSNLGTPVIDADLAPCVVCAGLQCTTVCPSGALRPVSDMRDIRMGTAEANLEACLRSRAQPCAECVDKCPLGASAIRFVDEGPPEVLREGCVGCGVCQFYCPTTPKAIVVEPAAI